MQQIRAGEAPPAQGGCEGETEGTGEKREDKAGVRRQQESCSIQGCGHV